VVSNFHVPDGHSIDFEIPSDLVSGNQNTEKPYAIPIHR
jgi:hypothetical protein